LVGGFGPEFRLARFQVQAAQRIMSSFEAQRSRATLVSAGTGSGKTLAFYLPALSRIASHIQADAAGDRWVKALALYPRNELLKDQFAEVYDQARKLDATLAGSGRRKILIATLFGDTPKTADHVPGMRKGWRRHSTGFICEVIRCPKPDCHGDMVWADVDRTNGREALSCVRCSHRIGSDEIILTRQRMIAESPDVLFTTTEMLNQRLSDRRLRHLFGIGDRCRRPVELMLLDEVHTYVGAPGAQVAFLLRRWRRLLARPVSFVGLSATLKDGARFFAGLTGLSEQASVEIAPSRSEMVAEGAEYLLALRGDPVSRTALLSTTIQTAMLMSRMLDAPGQKKSEGVFGERTFLFTDDIDVTNRMYFAMLDAEGRDSFGRVDQRNHPNGGLATLRRPMPGRHRKLHGQDWQAANDIGHSLQAQDRKLVGRVMSLDPGVGSNLDIVVATASLEVGYNDPLVGAVIQHKAPRDVAQFLQRKGRAGRTRAMRPWTIAVLSDYGRDRIAYQGYDALFDPELPLRTLPTGNRHVRRIQAVYASIDYLAQDPAFGTGNAWQTLAMPADNGWRQRQQVLATTIERILTVPSELERYTTYLSRALGLDETEIQLLLWEHPRPLLTQVLPTALRRLTTNWASKQFPTDYQVRNSPLPEFAPANLFSDLNLPEVAIQLPAPQNGAAPAQEPWMMPIVQAMRDFAPGRVSRRFGLQHAFERHWLAPTPDQNASQPVELGQFIISDVAGDWPIQTAGGAPTLIRVFRPRVMNVLPPPPNVVDTSNARLEWRSQIIARVPGLSFDTPAGTGWAEIVQRVGFFTHQGGAPVQTRRMALGSQADLRFRGGNSLSKRFAFEANGQPAALGFELTVDALCLSLSFPRDLWSELGGPGDLRHRAALSARFHHLAVHGPELVDVDNHFLREWLAQLLLTALSTEAISKGISLEQAAENLRDGQASLDLSQTLNILFQSPMVDAANGVGNNQDRLRQDLGVCLSDSRIVTGLFALAEILWSPIDATWEPWLREKFTATVGAATLAAISSLCPEIDSDGLVVDIDAGPLEAGDIFELSEGSRIWISELAPGGNGQIEEVLRQWSEDPRRAFSLITSNISDNEFGQNDFQLSRLLNELDQHPTGDIALAVEAFRVAYGSTASHDAFSNLRVSLAADGYSTFHGFLVAVANRVLRPGSSSHSDSFLLGALRLWDQEEARLGIELDAKVIAYGLSASDDIDVALNLVGIDAPTTDPRQWRFGAIYALLWPRGPHIRRAGLELYSPYGDLPIADPLLVTALIGTEIEPIDLDDQDWANSVLSRLAERGIATLSCSLASSSQLAEALAFLATNPVQTDYLSVFARVVALRRVGDAYHLDLDIAEARQ
jgi:hypothetical protein